MSSLMELQNQINLQKASVAVSYAIRNRSNFPELQKSGSDVPVLMRDDFGKFVSAEIRRWGGIVKDAGIKLD